MGCETVTVFPATLTMVVPGLMPGPSTDIPGTSDPGAEAFRVSVLVAMVESAWIRLSGPAVALKFCVPPKATVAPPNVTGSTVAVSVVGALRVTMPLARLMAVMTEFGSTFVPVTICPMDSVPASAGVRLIVLTPPPTVAV